MNHTRRTFLKSSAGLISLLPVLARTPLSAATNGAGSPPPKGATPGLLFDAADIPRIKANLQSPPFAGVWKEMSEVDLAAETKFLEHELRFTNHVFHLSRARITMERAAL